MPLMDIFHKKNAVETAQINKTIMVAGLGNPGREYRETRHNIGFMVVDRLSEKYKIALTRVQNKAIIGSGVVGDNKVILVKPQTYMNLSGKAVVALIRFYKIEITNLIVVHDDVDLPFSTIRLRPGGGSAGQKGVASIIEQLGTQDFARLRMGIGRPPGQMDAATYVLQTFSGTDKVLLSEFLERATEALDCYIKEGLESAMNRYNASDQG